MSQPLLSIGMIVKNEERCLEKCLKALEPLRQAIPCELVIADTGSTDKTVEIANKYADIVFYFKWINDFSAARNAVMDKCNGKWYLTVDADEYLLPDVSEIVAFLKSPLSSQKTFATITQRNYNDIDMKGTYSDFNALRMTRMNSGNRYGGTIHEAFHVTKLETVQILANTIFDHDGYAAVTPKHLKIKEKRNLDLLEAILEKNPDDLKCILQCLESSAHNPEKKRYYTEYAFKKLIQLTPDDVVFSEFIGPPCIRTIINYAIADNNPNVEEYAEFAFTRYANYHHVLVDVNFLYAGFLYKKERYAESVKHSKAYLKEVENYRKTMRDATITAFTTPVFCIHKNYEVEATSILTNSLLKLGEIKEASNLISKIDLVSASTGAINNWVVAVATPGVSEEIMTIAGEKIGMILEQHSKQELKSNIQYDTLITAISKTFNCKEANDYNYNHFKYVPGAIGLSVKIANATTKEEAEKLLNEIENWEELMPLALKNAIKLNADLPESFFLTSFNRISYLIKNLIFCTNDILDNLLNNYLDKISETKWFEISFYFNLISAILINTESTLNDAQKSTLITFFVKIADIFLNKCYNKRILNNEENVSCLPQMHIFAWYLLKANNLKAEHPLEYIRTLKASLLKVSQAKQIIEFLIEEFKNEEELKRQEKIKTASPELLQMAEQLKTMLSAFAPNSPELLAIKQSPVYQQVKFLIEE